MPTLASDQELLTRQAALQAEAAQVLAELDLGQLFADVGPVLVVGEARDERYHVPFDLDIGQGRWRIDLSVWLRDLHAHVADWHTELRDTITDEQRLAVLRIKDVWHRLPSYPDEVSGWEIYAAVLRDDVRTPEQFARWPATNGFPSPDAASRSARLARADGGTAAHNRAGQLAGPVT